MVAMMMVRKKQPMIAESHPQVLEWELTGNRTPLVIVTTTEQTEAAGWEELTHGGLSFRVGFSSQTSTERQAQIRPAPNCVAVTVSNRPWHLYTRFH